MEVQYYLLQIVSALKYLHQNKVIHREYVHTYNLASNWETFFSIKIWKLNWVILVSPLASNMMVKKRKPSVAHLTILPPKFFKIKDTPIKLISGPSES